jgi:hypothetical protein
VNTPRQRYQKIKALPSDVIAAFLEVEVHSRAHSISERVQRLRLTDNLIEWCRAIEVEADSIMEALDELADYPNEVIEVFVASRREHFEGEAIRCLGCGTIHGTFVTDGRVVHKRCNACGQSFLVRREDGTIIVEALGFGSPEGKE